MLQRIDAVILWSDDVDRARAFYRTLGVAFAAEDHDDGDVHYAADVAGVHLAILPANKEGESARRRGEVGCVPVSFRVDSLDAAMSGLASFAPQVLIDRQDGPWGVRVVIEDPDGRPVQLTKEASE